jgi:hypothetical protein
MDEKPGISSTRIAIWLVGIGVALYLIVSGLVGAMSH